MASPSSLQARASSAPSALPASTDATFHFAADVAAGQVPRAHALLVHGYSGSPYEVRPIGLALAAHGISATGIVLPGHCTDPHELNRVSWQDWMRAVDDGFDALPTDAPRILVGCSMGALLTLRLAAQRPRDVVGMVLLAPALHFLPAGRLGVAAAQAGLWRVQPLIAKETPGGDVGDREGAAKNATYPVLSVKGLVQLVALQEVVRPMLHDVTVPICTFHGARDHTIAPRSSTEVARRVHGRVVHHVLRQTQHLVALDVERDFVFQETLDFVDDVLAECVA